MIEKGSTVVVEKGCRARHITKGSHAYVAEVTPLGAEYNHFVKVVLHFGTSRKLAFYARHINRLSDPFVGLNDGNPNHRIEIRLRKKPQPPVQS